MNLSKIQIIDLLKTREGFSLILLLAFVIYFLAVTGLRIIQAYQLEGEWVEFNSQQRLKGENDPEGFSIEYPANWEALSYSGGGTKNLRELRAGFDNPYYLFSTKDYVSIWWRRVDESWTMYDVRDWYIEDIGFGISQSSLEQSRDSFKATSIGSQNLPSLEKTFYPGMNEQIRVVLFVVDNEAFVLEFQSNNYRNFESTFERMLNSFEVYE
ncbi:MAG: hypothetical protein DWQ04_19020 [Chloroflexi bacterium]|nr:MAG: hypothetical protein DWQ04_19020 [Chloroflexota bacterium]